MKIKNTDKRRGFRAAIVFISLLILFIAAFFLNINSGSVKLSLGEVFDIVFLRDESLENYNIMWKIRLPRMALSAVLGGALALSGFLLQTFFRNPIAGPFVLGISSGAKMLLAIVTIAVAGIFAEDYTSLPIGVTVLTAFLGSMLVTFVVLMFSGKVRDMSTLLVIGIMISYICSSVTDFLINFAEDADIVSLTHWSLGSFSGAKWQNVGIAAAIVFPAFILSCLASKPISAYALGEGYAKSVGVRIGVFRAVLIALSSVLSAAVTAFAGPISFVGIAVPHIARMSLGTNSPKLMIPAVFFGGAVFCMFCDLIARTIFSPTDLSIGTVTGIIGAPIVIWLMASRRKQND
ncbi:MAG: iron ABC transporter permease [Oscillospiraceae bacterium]|nr:iron ABC transporter permease [Oscillospiraceae bacterium]